MEPYKYTPLPDENHLRVLSVKQPYVDGDEIQCSILSIPIDGQVDYAALSYSWGMDADGDASVCEHILVDGKNFGITRNLLPNLRRIFIPTQNGDDFLPIWIDAVCIDQKNIDERNAQVARMAEIYSCATKVFVWLGEGTDYAESDGIAEALDCLSQPVHQHYHEHVVTTPHGNTAKLCLAHGAGVS